MRKIIQFALVVILIVMVFQSVVGSPIVSSGTPDEQASSSTSSALNTAVADTQMAAACLVRVKGVICVRPNVGWNS
jgi:uncharacterized protein (UPF0333 family)